MSGADLSADDIANGVFHALYPECPAFPGVPNSCDTRICDCFNADQLPAKVAELVTRVQQLEGALRWLVNLNHGIGKAGEAPEDGEWEDAIESSKAVLASTQRST